MKYAPSLEDALRQAEAITGPDYRLCAIPNGISVAVRSRGGN